MIKIAEVCKVNYGSHIGEYIRQKLKARGIMQSWLADQIGTPRQQFNRDLAKAEMYPSEVQKLAEHLPDGFFDEFYANNQQLKQTNKEKTVSPDVTEADTVYGVKGSGYTITIEIDPVNFEPSLLDPLSSSLKKALEEFHERIKQDEKRTK